jgi:hypothetical protein
MGIYLRVADFCLEADNVGEAETQVNRASLLQNEVKDPVMLTQYKSLYARVLDRLGRFIEAAQRYHEVNLFEIYLICLIVKFWIFSSL